MCQNYIILPFRKMNYYTVATRFNRLLPSLLLFQTVLQINIMYNMYLLFIVRANGKCKDTIVSTPYTRTTFNVSNAFFKNNFNENGRWLER